MSNKHKQIQFVDISENSICDNSLYGYISSHLNEIHAIEQTYHNDHKYEYEFAVGGLLVMGTMILHHALAQDSIS